MQIVVHGELERVEVSFLKRAANFFNKILLNNEKNVSVIFYFIKGYRKRGQFASCSPIEDTWFTLARPRRFSVEMDASLTKNNLGVTLAHEFVHIEQLFYGFLKIPPFNPALTWLGHPLDVSVAADAQPYEINARGRELYLYERFLKEG